MSRPVLLLTATVTPPPGAPNLKRTDPAKRLAEYRGALHFYRGLIGSTFESIVFAENSLADVSVLKRDCRGLPVEFLSTQQDHPVQYGRGYGEMRLIEFAMANSTLLRAAPVIWKCTGRYRLLNISRLVATRPEVELYVHCRNHPCRLCDLFSLAFTHRAFDEVIAGCAPKLRHDVPSGRHATDEMSFRSVVEATPLSKRMRFTHTPIVAGVRGWDESSYSRAYSPKIITRRVSNRVAPWFWI